MPTGVYKFVLGPYFYVGSAHDIPSRLRLHHRRLTAGVHWNPKVQAAFNKYGWTSDLVLEECVKEEAKTVEQKYLDLLFGTAGCANLSNRATGGGRPGVRHTAEHCKAISDGKRASGYRHSEATLEKMSQEQSRTMTEERKAKISAVNTGKKHSEETKTKISDANKGMPKPPRSAEHTSKLSTALKGKPWSDARRAAHQASRLQSTQGDSNGR